MTMKPRTIDIPNPVITAFPYWRSPNLLAIDALTILFDITAMRIVVAAMMVVKSHDLAPVEYAILIASTSARPDMRARP